MLYTENTLFEIMLVMFILHTFKMSFITKWSFQWNLIILL